MSLTPTTRLGPYEIIAPLGAGGMGEVYLARDTRLKRDIAIKLSRRRRSESRALNAKVVTAGAVEAAQRPAPISASCFTCRSPRFELPEAGRATIEVFDVTGRRAPGRVDESWSAGPHEVSWNAQGLGPGVYHARLTAGARHEVVRLVRVR